MDYLVLADELLKNFAAMSKIRLGREASEFSRGELAALNFLYANGGVTAGELCKKMGVVSGRMADMLKALEAKGFIRRRRDDNDKRRVLVFITDVGAALVRGKYKKTLEHISAILSKLGENDARELVRLSRRIVGEERD